MRGSLFAVLMVFGLLAGCETTNQRTTWSDREIEMLALSTDRTLSWRNYDGLGDPNKAVYYLGDRELGQGEAGLQVFGRIVEAAPPGARFRVAEYYSPFESPYREYPMNRSPTWQRIWRTAQERGITIVYPTLVSQP